jgi:hypothetical protein
VHHRSWPHVEVVALLYFDHITYGIEFLCQFKIGLTKYTVWVCIIQIEYIFQSCFRMSLVLILCVFHACRVYRGSFFFSLVLILRICAYLGIKGDQFFSDLGFFCTHFTYKLMYYNLYHVSDFTQNCPIFTQN